MDNIDWPTATLIFGIVLVVLGAIPTGIHLWKSKKASEATSVDSPAEPMMVNPEKLTFPLILVLVGVAAIAASFM